MRGPATRDRVTRSLQRSTRPTSESDETRETVWRLGRGGPRGASWGNTASEDAGEEPGWEPPLSLGVARPR